jgi:hypothetical protein
MRTKSSATQKRAASLGLAKMGFPKMGDGGRDHLTGATLGVNCEVRVANTFDK